MDGAAGLPLPELGGRTTLEAAPTHNLDTMARQGTVALLRTVPPGLDADSAVACMSIFGYDPKKYYAGRAPIEATSLGVPIGPGEVLFRCNLVTVQNGTMVSHSAGSITTPEAHELVGALNTSLGDENTRIYPGVSYRHILKLKDREDSARAVCTPPHDIPGKPIAGYLPRGAGSKILRDLMTRSEAVLKDHPVNTSRVARGELPATSIWLFWGSARVPAMPSFRQVFGLKAAVSSGVHLLNGLGKMAGMAVLQIPGVTGGLDNDYAAQAQGALGSLNDYDIVVIHVEAPDEAGHTGSARDKIAAIEKIDRLMVSRLRKTPEMRVLVTADHPTPVSTRTHNPEPVPCLLWGPGIASNGAKRLTEADGRATGLMIDPGHTVMRKLIGE